MPVERYARHNCSYQECRFCHSFYPGELLAEHSQLCSNNPTNQGRSPRSRHMGDLGVDSQIGVRTEHIPVSGGFIRRTTVESPELREPQNQQVGFFDMLFGWGGEPNQDAERERERQIVIERRHALEHQRELQRREEQRRLQEQQIMENPFVQFLGIMLGGPTPQRQNAQIHPFLQFNIQRTGGGQNEPNILILGNGNDLQAHQNFMQNNREHVRDANFIEDILNQLFVQGAAGNQPHTMNRNELTELKVIKFKKNPNVQQGEEEKCPICFMDFDSGEEVKMLPCKHVFHPGCIDTWLVRNCTCPICKRDVKDMLHGSSQPSRHN